MPSPPTDSHFKLAARAASEGKLTIFLGAGANFAQQSTNRVYGANANFLPTGVELAEYLATEFGYQLPTHVATAIGDPEPAPANDREKTLATVLRKTFIDDLGKVSQHAQAQDPGALNGTLHDIFSRDYPLTHLHKTLAALPSRCPFNRRPVFITTNYDTMMEQALAAANEPFDILYYRTPGPSNPVWLYHWKNAHHYYQQPYSERADTPQEPIDHELPIPDLANYSDLPLGNNKRTDSDELEDKDRARTLIVKIHGTVSPKGREHSTFILTPDDYIQFLRLVSLRTPLPTTLFSRLLETHFLFLGYGLGDWNILAICQNLWSQRTSPNFNNWAVQFKPTDADVARWNSTGPAGRISVFDQNVTDYAKALDAKFAPAPTPGAPVTP